MSTFYEMELRVDSRDVDLFNQCRPSALLGLLQEAATQAALALENRAEIRRWCGWRLGGRVCAFYQYVLDQDPGPLRRWDRVYRCYDTLRDAKSRLLYRR